MRTKFNGKFIQLLRTFSPEEVKDFELWLNSPWANTNTNITRLLKKLKKYAPSYDHKLLTKERLFSQVMPDKNYSNYWINNLLSLAYGQAEQFLTTRRMLVDENLKTDLIAQEFQNRDLEAHFFKTTDQETERLEGKEIKDWEDYLDLLRINRRINHHPNQNPKNKLGAPAIVKMDKNLDLLYVLEKAAIINEKIFRNRILKDGNHDIKADLKKWYAASEDIEHLAVELYRRRFRYTEENMREEYLKLFESFKSRFEQLNAKDRKIHYVSLMNDTTYLRRRGKIELTEILDLYKFGLETDLILDNQKLSQGRFISIVTIANAAGEFEFTRSFIEKFLKKLPESVQKDAHKWAYANTAYKAKNLEECLEFLRDDNFKNIDFKIVGRFLKLQAYFEKYIKDESYLFYLNTYFDTFEKWITREKETSKNLKASYLKFVQNCRALLKAATKIDVAEKEILDLIQKEQIMVAAAWFKQMGMKIIEVKKRGQLQ